MYTGRDVFGFKLGTKKSKAAMFYLEEGATNEDIKYELGGSQMNLLFEVSEMGHIVVMTSIYNRGTKKSNTVYNIKFNENARPVNFRKLSIERMKELGFQSHQLLDGFVTIWLIPFHLKKAIPEGFSLITKAKGIKFKMVQPIPPWHRDTFDNGPNGNMYVGMLPTHFPDE